MQALYGRVAVVVAGSDGVGAAIARCFGELGASVVVNYASDKAGAERVVAKIVRSGGRAVAFQSDMANEVDFGNAVSCARLNFGNPEFVFNNTRDYLQDVSAPRPEEDYLSELRGYFAQAAGANPAFEADLAHIDRVNMLGELVASISHDLAQPITVTTAHAKASLRWLQRDPPDLAEVRKGTERIIEAGKLASEIISRLRSLYKKTTPHRESVDVGEVIGEMVLLLRGEANGYAVSIRTDLAAGLPKFTADRVQLQQVLMNLMLNGIEAIKDTGGVVTVKSQLGEDGQIEISVNDTGAGLPLGKTDQIFDAFFTTKPQGSGMGLAISKSIVESHGGRIWANGDGARGATFHFTLPAASTERDPPVDAGVIQH
jgi:signal transduction histidine kinase